MEALAAVIGAIVLLIIWGIVTSKLRKRRITQTLRQMAPELTDHIQANRRYNIFLSHGKLIENALFIGITKSVDPNDPYLPFPLSRWLIITMTDGRKAFIKPETVRYYEEATKN